MTEFELSVRGMTCSSCEAIVEQRVTGLDGVASVDADAGDGVVEVEGSGADQDAVAERIEETGYEVVE